MSLLLLFAGSGEEEEDEVSGTAGRWRPRRNRKLEWLNREDNEIFEIIIAFVTTLN